MASVVAPYLVKLSHPTYPQRTVVVNALTAAMAQAMATANAEGTLWTVVSVAPLVAQSQ